jgi:glutamate/aspartate transport system substrate-binding protein
MDDVQLAVMAALSKTPAAYAIGEENLNNPEPYGIMLRRDDPAFKALVNCATGDLFRSPEMAALYDRWFTKPTPPNGINYNFPISPFLKKAFAEPSDEADPAHYVK